MGGTISVVIRDMKAEVHKLLAWTNPTPYFIHDLRFIAKDAKYFADYIHGEDKGGFLAPCDYGLLVIDLITEQVIHCQDYSDYARHFISSNFPRSEEELAAYMDEDKTFSELYDAGRLRNIVLTERGSETKVNAEQVGFVDGIDFVKKVHTQYLWADFDVDLSPWDVRAMPDSKDGWKEFRGVCMELFGLSNDDEAEWDDWIEENS